MKYEYYEYDEHDFSSGLGFEHYCADLLRRNDYQDVKLTFVHDGGVDITAHREGIFYVFQCKLRKGSTVGRDAIQQIFTGRALYGADKGVVMTNAPLTRRAASDAYQLGIDVWSEDYLRLLSNN